MAATACGVDREGVQMSRETDTFQFLYYFKTSCVKVKYTIFTHLLFDQEMLGGDNVQSCFTHILQLQRLKNPGDAIKITFWAKFKPGIILMAFMEFNSLDYSYRAAFQIDISFQYCSTKAEMSKSVCGGKISL